MLNYEIRTIVTRRRSSLIMFARCPNDLTAILLARDFTRRGEAVEVWRDDRLVYRLAASAGRTDLSFSKRELKVGEMFLTIVGARK